jgi:prepilin-type N-terminal cleavage/methylation domain-containing protein
MRRSKGFTLIELMIVIAIIAIIAAIAIPGLLSAQRSANERNASASLKTMATAEIDFRSNDRDTNRVNDFWTVNVCGLALIEPATGVGTFAPAIKLIDPSIAQADNETNANLTISVPATAAKPWGYQTRPTVTMTNRGAKAGYWYYPLQSDFSESAAGELYALDTDGADDSNSHHHAAKFGFGAFPDTYGVGRSVFMINESATVIRYPLPGDYIRPNRASYPPGTIAAFPASATVALSLLNYPNDTTLGQFSKLD